MRNRLLVGVVVGSVAVLAAGTPGLVDTSGELSDAQERVDLARLNRGATALAHALADERQAVLAHRASGAASPEDALTSAQRALVDRQVEEVRADAPRRLRQLVDGLPELRRTALGGDGAPLAAHQRYTEVIQELNSVAAEAARALPVSATDRTAEALPSLVRAVEQAAAVRDLLVVALAGDGADGTRGEAVEAARLADVRQRAAVADFRQLAATDARDSYTETVTGPEVDAAERHLERLTGQPWWDGQDGAGPDHRGVEAALSARIDLMRGVTSALAVDEVERLEGLRDDGVTDLEIQIALLGAFLLLAVGSGVQTARSMARPLAVLRRGARRVAADPVEEEPVRFTGRDDEFADVVRAVNELQQAAVTLQRHSDGREDDRDRLAGSRDRLAAERAELLREYEALRQRLTLARQPSGAGYAHLALRALDLVERQLSVLARPSTGVAERERAVLDQLAVRIRRHCQNLLLLAGGAQPAEDGAHPEPLAELVRAATHGIEDNARITVGDLPADVRVVGSAARDLVRVLAELLDNAVSFSTHDGTPVEVRGRTVEDGLLLSVLDQGIGMTLGRMAELNAGLEDPESLSPPAPDATDALRLGLYAVARLAARHGLGVRLSARREGGIAAEVRLTAALLVPVGPVPPRSTAAARAAEAAPGAEPDLTAELGTGESAPESTRSAGSPVAEAEHPGAGGIAASDTADAGTADAGTADEVRGPVTGPWWGGGAAPGAPHAARTDLDVPGLSDPTGARPEAADPDGLPDLDAAPESHEAVNLPDLTDPVDPVDLADPAATGTDDRAPAAYEPAGTGAGAGAGALATEGAPDAEGVPDVAGVPVAEGLSDAVGAVADPPYRGAPGPVPGASASPEPGADPVDGSGAVPPLPPPPVGTPHRQPPARLALTDDDPLVEAARRAEREAALDLTGSASGSGPGSAPTPLADAPTAEEEPPPGGTPGEPEPADSGFDAAAEDPAEEPATGADALVRAAGPYLIEPGEHARPTRDDGLRTGVEPESSADGDAPRASGGTGATAPAEHETPEEHGAPRHGSAQPAPAQPAPLPVRSPEEPRTAAGLPQRTPRPPADPGLPPPRPQGRLDPEELRRRLGGFQRGARDGRQAAESDFAAGREWSSGRAPEPDGARGAAAPVQPEAGRGAGRAAERRPRPGTGSAV